MFNAHLTQYEGLLDKDRLAFDKSMAINLDTLLLDGDLQGTIYGHLEVLDVIQGS